MIEQRGDVFTTAAKYIGHGVNVDGVMGAGIAKIVRDNWPELYERYKSECKHFLLVPGDYSSYNVRHQGRSLWVINFATQDRPGPNAQYEWVFSSFMKFAKKANQPQRLKDNGGIIAIPEIGCGIGGLEWRNVKKIIKCVESIYPNIEFEVWHYQ